MIDSSAGVSFEAMLLAMAALSLISPVSVDAGADVAVFVEVALPAVVGADVVEEVSAVAVEVALPNQEETCENGLTDPALPVVATDVPDPCRL